MNSGYIGSSKFIFARQSIAGNLFDKNNTDLTWHSYTSLKNLLFERCFAISYQLNANKQMAQLCKEASNKCAVGETALLFACQVYFTDEQIGLSGERIGYRR